MTNPITFSTRQFLAQNPSQGELEILKQAPILTQPDIKKPQIYDLDRMSLGKDIKNQVLPALLNLALAGFAEDDKGNRQPVSSKDIYDIANSIRSLAGNYKNLSVADKLKIDKLAINVKALGDDASAHVLDLSAVFNRLSLLTEQTRDLIKDLNPPRPEKKPQNSGGTEKGLMIQHY